MRTSISSRLALVLASTLVGGGVGCPRRTRGRQAPLVVPNEFERRADPAAVDFVFSRFERFPGVGDRFAFQNLAGMAAIPTREAPVRTFGDLQRGVIIGLLYAPSGSDRLKLAPGAYVVQLVGDSRSGWQATFLDERQRVRSTVPARVQQAERVSMPLAFVDHSVCYRFDETVVCI